MTKIKYLTQEELKEKKEFLEEDGSIDLASGDYEGYIDDAIRECADNYCDVYTSDLMDWLKYNTCNFDDYTQEFGSSGDVVKDTMGAQWYVNYNNISNELEEIITNYIINYLIDNDKQITQEQLDDLLIFDTYSFDRFSEIDDYIEEQLEESRLDQLFELYQIEPKDLTEEEVEELRDSGRLED